MPITLELHADEKSTYKITAAFTDSAGSAVTPDTIIYKLTNVEGTIINSKEAVSVTPDTSVEIVLSGNDLAMQTGETGSVERVVTLEAVYDSDEGNNLPLKEEAVFIIDPLLNVGRQIMPVLSESVTFSESLTISIS